MPLTSVWLRLSVERPIVFQSFSGFASRGIFFEMLKSYDGDIASLLHSGKGLAPYSTTPILADVGRGLRIAYRHLPACMASFRVCLLEYELSRVFLDLLISDHPTIKLIDQDVPLVNMSVNVMEFSDFLKNAGYVRRFAIRFKTPCFFRTTPRSLFLAFPSKMRSPSRRSELKRFHLFPEPVLMFRQLVRLWRAFSTNQIRGLEDFLSWVEAGGVSISGFPRGLRTIRVYEHPDSNKWAVGFVGRVYFNLPDDIYSKRHARIVDALLRFAEYSNLGGNRTAGFGVIDYEPFVSRQGD